MNVRTFTARGWLVLAIAVACLVFSVSMAFGAEPFRPIVMRVGLQGPGYVLTGESRRFETRPACEVERDALAAKATANGGWVQTLDGKRWQLVFVTCVALGRAA